MKATRLIAVSVVALLASSPLTIQAASDPGYHARQWNEAIKRGETPYEAGYRIGYDDGAKRDDSRWGNRTDEDAPADFVNGYRAGYDDGRAGRTYNNRQGVAASGDRYETWRRRYNRIYTQGDDGFYKQCHPTRDVKGEIEGTGNPINNECSDLAYGYQAFQAAMNSNRTNEDLRWRNPNTRHRGVVRIREYFSDPDGFRCASFSQRAFIGDRLRENSGVACQQPDGAWVIVS